MPSPYGFLSTLLLAVVPTDTAWQSLYLANAAASAFLGICLYFALRAVQPRPLGSVIALAASAAVVFLVSTYPPHALTGTLRPHVGRVLCHVREPPGGAWHRAMRQPVMKVMLNSQARGHCIARGGAPPDQSASVKTRRSSESWSAEDGMGS